MSIIVKQPVEIACLFTWIGFVCAISFLEAWLKFRAPGVTVSTGLSIGKLVFHALNKIEWVFAVVVIVGTLMNSSHIFSVSNIALLIVVTILIVQTLHLLPALDRRADQYINKEPTGPSALHIWFVISEVAKVTGLFITAVSLFKRS